jgi:pSer/pThr/pTyr-binding forkhead associated (FHA) protein
MDIILNDPAADRQHAVIFWHDGRYWVRNLSRSRGTRVNGQWIREHQLGNGNKIRMGNTELILREQR